jgi:hypothetical protein
MFAIVLGLHGLICSASRKPSGSPNCRSWGEPGGEYAYIELELREVQYNVHAR